MAIMSSDVLHVTNLELVLVTLVWQRDSLGHSEDPKVIPHKQDLSTKLSQCLRVRMPEPLRTFSHKGGVTDPF